MNSLIEEYLAEERRRDIQREMRGIRLEQEAMRGKVFHPSWFTRVMQALGQWLITQGERLVKRYETPKSRYPRSGRSFAQ